MIDHDAIKAKPYVSIRKVERVVEEYDVDERKAQEKLNRERAELPLTQEERERRDRLRAKLLSVDDDEY